MRNRIISGTVLAIAFLFYLSTELKAEQTGSQEKTVIRYSDFGAKGDGVTNDMPAIVKAHQAANKSGLPVQGESGAVYYIGNSKETAIVQTDTDWMGARFIIDDSKVEVKDRGRDIFVISSTLPSQKIKTVKTLQKDQKKLDISFPYNVLVMVVDNSVKRFIRYGANQNNGTAQIEVFVANTKGEIESRTPIIWNYDNISSITAFPIDSKTLTVRGGRFTTVANQAESKYTYYARGINISRSNVVIEELEHAVTNELGHGAPYGGFINISKCAGVTVQNCMFSGHKTYCTIGSANIPVSMGSYDISVGMACGITFKNCKQFNSIHDTSLWGIYGSNFTKNITFDRVEFSRFDAHMGVTNATIKNSSLGQQGINLIGTGTFLIENSKVYGINFISLRSDYGSTFDGEIIIKNCEYTPRSGKKGDAVLIGGSNSGQHDFGYTCFMPGKITIDGLAIHDGNSFDKKTGLRLFSNFNRACKDESYKDKYPYILPKEVVLGDLVIDSGRPWIVSDNAFMFRNVKITKMKDK